MLSATLSLVKPNIYHNIFKDFIQMFSRTLTQILDIVVETSGEGEETPPAAVSRGELAGAEERVTEPLGPASNHQETQYQSKQCSAYGKLIS